MDVFQSLNSHFDVCLRNCASVLYVNEHNWFSVAELLLLVHNRLAFSLHYIYLDTVCGLCGVTQDDVELPRDPVKLDLPPVLTLCVWSV